ncbi:bacillithiol biosynthesis cysteine-adding enzyme BshC [Flavobacterium sp.]|uniref:bacillithiol biosynthesis cysteine-adding enzyme BshC n=1 Tax=Flavobacterium sp. TaxID=239 RepID=UPI0026331FDA|nr:bacillithiol biosynthesis cysteine-adding enzyme BshC [Flavobacterium sp.]MDD3004405.1 bacillithiol biosynthesis cysteine-adding enzyme BshC [Flavobacterium sp.]
MPTDCISYQESGYFTPLMNDYLDQKTHLQSLYNRFPSNENFAKQIAEKQVNYNDSYRKILVDVLQKQYEKLSKSELVLANIEALKEVNTFTITTGHQLNLFTGPLYFLYKIVSTINLAKELKAKYPDKNFVPVYWMATEDHDFEEINYFNFKGKKIRWNKKSTGPVGRLSTDGLDNVLKQFEKDLGIGKNAAELKQLFESAYLKHSNLAQATRFLAHSLFAQYGLVIIDADQKELKNIFAPYIKQELLTQNSVQKVEETSTLLANYKIQVHPREINLFYIENNLRERIIKENNLYKINNTELSFTTEEMIELLEQSPEKFSPNVIMRPLYQEVILPNLCYIGGGGELAYWLQLKSYFDDCNITFPVLLLRNSVVLASKKQSEKADRLQLSWNDLFKKTNDLKNWIVKKESPLNLDFSEQKKFLKQQFDVLRTIATQTDPSFIGAVNAQEAKQIKGLNNLEKRLIQAEKKQHADVLNRILALQNELFPNGGLQERTANFSEFYLESGNLLIEKLVAVLAPLENRFEIIVV